MNSLIKSYRKTREEVVKDNPRMEGVKREFVVEIEWFKEYTSRFKVGEEWINEVIEYTNGWIRENEGKIEEWRVREYRRGM